AQALVDKGVIEREALDGLSVRLQLSSVGTAPELRQAEVQYGREHPEARNLIHAVEQMSNHSVQTPTSFSPMGTTININQLEAASIMPDVDRHTVLQNGFLHELGHATLQNEQVKAQIGSYLQHEYGQSPEDAHRAMAASNPFC